MRAGTRYLLGLAIAAAVGCAIGLLMGPKQRDEVMLGVLIGLLVQAPLGWWTIRSIGRPRFQLVWLAGMLARLGVVAVAALVQPAMLLPLVATLILMLAVEAWTAAGAQFGLTSP